MLAQLWGGVFDTSPLKIFEDFNQSLPFDQTLWAFDILGSIAHVTMLGKQGYLTEDETHVLIVGLQTLYQELETSVIGIDMTCEDIHSFVEKTLTDRLGTVGKKIHMGRSRNDQGALDMKLYTRAKITQLLTLLEGLIRALCKQAQQNTHTIMPGFTHLQVAQPITFGYHLMAYTEMFLRDRSRLMDCLVRLNACPLGAGALATSTINLDRHFVAEQLGFDDVTYNALDTVSDRDYERFKPCNDALKPTFGRVSVVEQPSLWVCGVGKIIVYRQQHDASKTKPRWGRTDSGENGAGLWGVDEFANHHEIVTVGLQ